MKIIKARITAQPKNLFDEMPKVFVLTEDNKDQFLFEYYPDEITFNENEFVGLTIDEAIHMKFCKDKLFLQS
jgi:hypothetical protein